MVSNADNDTRSGRSLMVLALIVLAVSVWWAVSDPLSDRGAKRTLDVAGSIPAMPDEVRDYLRFVDRENAPGTMTREHKFTVAGIESLAAAVVAIAGSQRPDVVRVAQAVRNQAMSLQRDPRSREHAAQAREAFTSLAGLLESLQRARFPGIEFDAANVRRAAESIRRGVPLLDQEATVHEFFNRAAATITLMTSSAAVRPRVDLTTDRA